MNRFAGKRLRADKGKGRKRGQARRAACEKSAAKSGGSDDHGAHHGTEGPGQRPARAHDPNGAIDGVGARAIEASLDERDGLGEGGRANRDRERGDDHEGHKIGREPKQAIADRRACKGDDQRFERGPLVDPGAESRAESNGAGRSRGQDRAQRKRAQGRLVDEKEHDVGKRDRIGEANEDVDDDKPNEERRAVGVRWSKKPRCCDEGRRRLLYRERIERLASGTHSRPKRASRF